MNPAHRTPHTAPLPRTRERGFAFLMVLMLMGVAAIVEGKGS